MLFVQSQAEKLNISTLAVTFDDPLWWKASGIIAETKLDILCRLGRFQSLMSFIGSIGYVMGGSGLEDVFTEVYAADSVLHMLSRKAYTRAEREYIHVDSPLNNMLIEDVMPSLERRHIAKKALYYFPKGGYAEEYCREALAELAKN